MLVAQTNIANSFNDLGRFEEALELERDIYRGSLRLLGEEDEDTLISVNNYALSLIRQKCFKESKALLRKMIPVARRVLGENHAGTLRLADGETSDIQQYSVFRPVDGPLTRPLSRDTIPPGAPRRVRRVPTAGRPIPRVGVR